MILTMEGRECPILKDQQLTMISKIFWQDHSKYNSNNRAKDINNHNNSHNNISNNNRDKLTTKQARLILSNSITKLNLEGVTH